MDPTTMEHATDNAIKFAHVAHEAAKAKVLLDDAIEDGKREMRRLASRGYETAEDLMENTTHYIKRNPWRSIGFTLGVAGVTGLFVGWLLTRNSTPGNKPVDYDWRP